MTHIVIYEDNGRISNYFTGPISVLNEAHLSFENSLLLDREPLPSEYVENGAITSMGDAPDDHYVFSFDSKQWEYDLPNRKQVKWQEIKADRDAEEFGTFTWSTHIFQCNEVSQRRIQGAVQLAQLDSTTTLDWTLADNSVQTFNATELQQIGQALAAHVNACHVKSRTKRVEIDAATTQTELDAITW